MCGGLGYFVYFRRTASPQNNSLLLHRVSLTDGHAVVILGIEIVGHAVRRADLVLSSVALANVSTIVVFDVPILRKLVMDRHSRLCKLL